MRIPASNLFDRYRLAVAAAAVALAAAPAFANVYATDLRWGSAAVNVSSPDPSAIISFRLNEQADLGVTLTISDASTLQVIRTAELGPLQRGPVSWTWDLKDNAGQLVSPGRSISFKLEARSTGHQDWQQISSDWLNTSKFYFPRSVFVNRNPSSRYFGWVYVNNPLPGRTTYAPYPRRTLGRGVYALRADGTEPLAQGDTAFDGGVAWTGSSVSPFHIFVGEDDKLYLFDWTDDHGGVWVAPPELGGNWTALLSPSTQTPGGVSPPAVHGSISEGVVIGKGVDRALVTIDEDLLPPGSGVAGAGSVWKYQVGPLDQEITTPPQLVFSDSAFDTNQYLQSGIAAADGGTFLISQWVSNGLGLSSLYKVPSSGSQPLWRSLVDWGSPDPLAGNRGAGIAYHPARSRVASAAADYGVVNVGPASFVRNRWTSFGGGILTWAVGDLRTALVSAGGAANSQTFSPAVAADSEMILNGVHIARSGSGTNGWAVGSAGEVIRIHDSVLADAESSPVADDIYAVRAISDGTADRQVHGWAGADKGSILKNLNGQWVLDSVPVTKQLNRIAPRYIDRAGMRYDLYIVGNQGAVLKRLDATNTQAPTQWEVLYSPIAKNLNDIAVVQYGQQPSQVAIYIVGDTGSLMKSMNAGLYFFDRTYDTTSHLRSVFAKSVADVWVVGDRGFVMHSLDGETWNEVDLGVSEDLLSVWFQDQDTGWIAGTGGLLLRTRDGGATWVRVQGTGTGDITAVTSASIAQGSPRDVAFDAAGNLYVTDDTSELLRVFSPPDGLNFYVSTSPAALQTVSGDPSQPAAPVVSAAATTASTTSLTASWASSCVLHQYAIGLCPEDLGQYIVPWTSAAGMSATAQGLALQTGRKYFWYVRGRSASGVWSPVGVSGGTLVTSSLASIGAARLAGDGEIVRLESKLVTRSTTDSFWIQEQDQSAGVRVASTAEPPVGSLVTVTGRMSGAGGERFVLADSVQVLGPALAGAPEPLTMAVRSVGASAAGGAGLATDGLLVRVAGVVRASLPGSQIIIDDQGTFTAPANPAPGVRVDVSAAGDAPPPGKFVLVTGIVRLKSIAGQLTPVIDAVPGGIEAVN